MTGRRSNNSIRKQMSSQVQPLLAGIGCALLASLLVAQTETFPPSDVSFKVSTAQTSWKAGESITLKCRVKNISNAVLFVPRYERRAA